MIMYNQEANVDKIIMDEIVLQYPELKSIIKKTSPHEVRGGVLSVLDKNKRTEHSIYKFYYELCKKDINMKHIDDMVIHLWNYINSANVERKLFAEVMTPKSLVNDMLDRLPKSVWSNKDLKWFDPCNGVGTFPSIVVQRLMKGLENVIPNPKKRYRHIIEEMIYVCELQAKNMYIFHCVFDKQDIYELNTFYGSFLSDEFDEYKKNIWGIDKFDIIIGNPPYQTTESHGKKTTGNGALWVLFSVKVISLLNDNGFLNFVTPDSWSAPTYDLMGSRESLFTDYYMKYNLLHVDFDKHFNVGVNTSTILLQKNNKYKHTTIKSNGEIKKIDLRNFNFIPKDLCDLSLSIHSKILKSNENDNKIKMRWTKPVTSNKVNEIKNAEFKYEIIDHYTYKPIRYGKNKDIDMNRKKLLFPYVGEYQVILDEKGIYGAKPQVSILFTDDVNSAFSFYNSKLIHYIMNKNKWTQYLLTQILNYIKTPKFDRQWTDKQLYKYFKLSQEEINLIESQTK
jgi:hypothetical protein